MKAQFSQSTVEAAWRRAGGKCECTRLSCGHVSRCNKTLSWTSRGSESAMGWEAHHINPNGADVVSNCQILCQPCHKNTPTYGR